MIVVYAMCGSANFDSLGIMIGGRGAVVLERRDEIVELGIKCIMVEKIAACMVGAV